MDRNLLPIFGFSFAKCLTFHTSKLQLITLSRTVQSCATAHAPSPSESGSGTRWSPSAASRLARPRTPRLAARVATADCRVRTQAVLPQPSGSRFQTRWFLHLLFWRRHEMVPEPFSCNRSISHIATKLSRANFFIRRKFNFVSYITMHKLFFPFSSHTFWTVQIVGPPKLISIFKLQKKVLHILTNSNCFASSPRRPDREYKRMVFEHTHGLFIT